MRLFYLISYENTIKIMRFEGTVIEIKRFRKTNCMRIFYVHVIVEIAG